MRQKKHNHVRRQISTLRLVKKTVNLLRGDFTAILTGLLVLNNEKNPNNIELDHEPRKDYQFRHFFKHCNIIQHFETKLISFI